MGYDFSQETKKILHLAEDLSRQFKNYYLGVEHLFLAILKLDSEIAEIFCEMSLDANEILEELTDVIKKKKEEILWKGIIRTPRFDKVLRIAQIEAKSFKSDKIGPGHIFISILNEGDSSPVRFLCNKEVNIEELKKIFSSRYFEEKDKRKIFKKEVKPSFIDKFSRNLTKLAKENRLEPVIGREKEVRRLIQILTRKGKNNPILIGEAGVGKTAVVSALAIKVAHGKAPEQMKNKQIIDLSLSSIVAGTQHRGEFEDRLQKIMKEVEKNPDVILFIDEIHTIVGAGASGSGMSAANILKPALARGEFPCIGSTTLDEYRKFIEKDSALERRFQPVLISEPTEEETLQILKGLKNNFELHHGVTFTEKALINAVKLSVRYLPDRNLPDKAIDLIDEAAAKVKTKTISLPLKEDKIEISGEDIAEVVSSWTQIPVKKITQEETEKILHLEEILKEKIVGQDDAVRIISQTIQMIKTGLIGMNRPLGVFMFVGPTGVGKTYLAKTLADFLFGSEKEIIRVDMSEYMEKHTVSKLIGAPPGYVGYEDEGQLTKKVRAKPYSVILLDEIEKAHPEIFDIFLQVFDEGRLTDAKGRTVNFCNTIIIMTSNLGTEKLMDLSEDKIEEARLEVLKAVRKHFRPEFINRIDEVIFFNPLKKDALAKIVKLSLNDLEVRIKEKGLSWDIDDSVIDFVIELGYDMEYGARPINRTIQNLIAKPLAKFLLEGKFSSEDKILVKVTDNQVLFERI